MFFWLNLCSLQRADGYVLRGCVLRCRLGGRPQLPSWSCGGTVGATRCCREDHACMHLSARSHPVIEPGAAAFDFQLHPVNGACSRWSSPHGRAWWAPPPTIGGWWTLVACTARTTNLSPTCFLPGFTFSFFYRIPPTAGNEISAEISPNFANSERKENSNSKTKFRWIPTEISVISTEIRWFLSRKWCQLWFSYCFRGQMKNFWIPTLFSFSISTTFVSGTFLFELRFVSYFTRFANSIKGLN